MLLDELTKIGNDTAIALATKGATSLQKEVNRIGDKPSRSQNEAPAPDFASAAARAQEAAGNFMSSSVMGIPAPLLIAGVGIAAFILLKRK